MKVSLNQNAGNEKEFKLRNLCLSERLFLELLIYMKISFQKVTDLEITEEGQSHERLLEAVKKHIKYSVQTGGILC